MERRGENCSRKAAHAAYVQQRNMAFGAKAQPWQNCHDFCNFAKMHDKRASPQIGTLKDQPSEAQQHNSHMLAPCMHVVIGIGIETLEGLAFERHQTSPHVG